jgi:predicted transcriptional regulator
MLNIEQVRAGLKYANLPDVAEHTGVHYQTITRVARGDYDPARITYAVVEKISDYLLSPHYLEKLKGHQKAVMAAREQADAELARIERGE